MKIEYFSNAKFLAKGLLGYLAYVSIFPFWMAAWLHKLRGVKIGKCRNVYIAPNVVLDTLYPELLTIQDYVYITRGVKVLCHTNLTPPMREICGVPQTLGEVFIGEGAYLGVNAIVLPSVRIGRCALVAAGAVVTKDVPDYAVVAGNPARVISDIRSMGASQQGTSR